MYKMKTGRHSKLTKLVSIFLVFFYLHISGGLSCASFTMQDEKKLGKEFYDKLKEKGSLLENSEVKSYVEGIGKLLLSHSENFYFDFTFSIIDSQGINAFATPGGYVYVYKGLIELAEDEGQLAGVMAHEIAHIKARHIAKMIESSQKLGLATLAAVLAGAFLGGDAGSAAIAFSSATAATLSLKYSREHEEEADRMGMLYLTQAGYDGEGMLDFLKIMRQQEFYSNSIPSYFLTHPGTGERIQYLDGLLHTRYKNRGAKSIVGKLEKIKTALVISRKDSDSGIAYFQDLLKKDPENPNALYGLAVIQGRLGRTSESFSNFQKALSLSPDDPEILRDLGIAYFNLGKISDAVDNLRRAYLADNNNPETIQYLARSYTITGNYSAALELYKKLKDKNPDDVQSYHNLAMLYGKLEMQGESHYHFGIFFKKEHKNKSALFHFKAAQPFFPEGDETTLKIKEEIDAIEKAPPDRRGPPGFPDRQREQPKDEFS